MKTRRPAEHQIKEAAQKLRGISPKLLLARNTWKRLSRWVRWNISPKRRNIRQLTRGLIPLDKDAAPEVRMLRDEVFERICLSLNGVEDRRNLLELLNGANKPLGPEQLFLSAIYPQIVNRNFGITRLPTSADHRLDVEIGYLGHNEDYFFWIFEIDGKTEDKPGRTLTPVQKIRGDKRYLIYRLGVAGLVHAQNADAVACIIRSQVLFTSILADLKKRNYKVTAASIPHFEWGRLSLLRRLTLNELKKRRFRS